MIDSVAQISVSLLYPSFRPVIERGLLKSQAVRVDLSVSHCGSISICFIHFEGLLLGASIFRIE